MLTDLRSFTGAHVAVMLFRQYLLVVGLRERSRQDTHEVATARRRSKATWCKRTPEKCLAGRWRSAEACMDRIPDDDQNFFFVLVAFAEALGARLKKAKGPPDSDNLDPATEESEVWEIRTNRWAKESLFVMNEKKKGFRVMKLIVRKAF